MDLISQRLSNQTPLQIFISRFQITTYKDIAQDIATAHSQGPDSD